MSKRGFAIVLIWGIISSMALSLQAQKWEKQGKFDGNEHFEYKITTKERGKERELTYILDLKKAGDGYEASYTTKGKIAKDQLGMQAAFGLVGLYGISLNAIVLNPMTTVYFQQLNLSEGEKMSFYGAGLVKVTGKETVSGQEGYICEFYQTQGEEEKLISTITVNPQLPLPIRSKLKDSEAILMSYKKN